ncbi:MAG: hypothetical protein UHX00_13275 [Caryophanon sp.]|nr:hypothetical protein [Caryophanon sp.]
MTIQNCERCRALFHKKVKDICPACVQKEDDDFQKIRLFLKRNKTIELITVSKETGVELDVIYQFLQEGRVILSHSVQSGYPCKECGTTISTGALCTPCEEKRNDVHQTLQAHATSDEEVAAMSVEDKEKGGFHTKR